MALMGRGCSAAVQYWGGKSLPKGGPKMLTIGWLVVLLGVLAIEWADGRFSFSASL
jgi:hypothetical protein